MKTSARPAKPLSMSSDAYAGFLKLWLTPTHTLPPLTPDVTAYLGHANVREPLSDSSRGTPPAQHAA
jgi:hypothetical protein